MRAVLTVGLMLLAGCGDGMVDAGPEGPLAGLIQTSTQTNFTVGSSYRIADYWQAYNADHQPLPMVTPDGLPVDWGFRYAFADTVAAESREVDPATGAIPLAAPFAGTLYLFAPTDRAPLAIVGQHVMVVTAAP